MNESEKATGGRLTSGSRLCEDLDVRLPYLKQHGGGCMAYSTLAEDVEAFVVPDLGYVAYARQRLLGERVFVLADPIAPPERWGEILDLFLAQRPRAVFVQIGERTAALLRERGRVVNEMGTETDIDVPSFKLSAGPLAASLERALHGLAALDVAQRDSNLGRAATHLDVVVVEDLPEVAIELDGHALAQLAGADHGARL